MMHKNPKYLFKRITLLEEAQRLCLSLKKKLFLCKILSSNADFMKLLPSVFYTLNISVNARENDKTMPNNVDPEYFV